MNKAFVFRIYPNKEQRILLAKTFGCARFIWNKMLSDKKSPLLEEAVGRYSSQYTADDDVSKMMMAMLSDMPLRSLAMFGTLSMEAVEEIVQELNR